MRIAVDIISHRCLVGLQLIFRRRADSRRLSDFYSCLFTQAEFLGRLQEIVYTDIITQRRACSPVLPCSDTVEVVVARITDTPFHIFTAVGSAIAVPSRAGELTITVFDYASVVDIQIRIQSTFQRGQSGDRLKGGSRSYRQPGRIVVQRRRRQRISRILRLYGFPCLRGNTVGKDIRIIRREAGQGQHVPGLYIESDYRSALTVFRIIDSLFQRALCRFLQIQINGQIDIGSLLRLCFTYGFYIFAGTVDSDLLGSRRAVQLFLKSRFYSVFSHQIAGSISFLVYIVLGLAFGDGAHVAQDMAGRIPVRIVPFCL